MIKIYSSHTCPYCEKLERYFDSIDLEYDILYIDDDDALVDELVDLTGIAGVPVTVFENGEFVIGYDRENIDKQLAEREEVENHAKAKSTKVKVTRAPAKTAVV